MSFGKSSRQVVLLADDLPVSLKTVSDSAHFLLANKIDTIARPFRNGSQHLSRGASWIWSSYTIDEQRHNVMHILETALAEYRQFVAGNLLQFGESLYLNSSTTVVMVYEPPDEHKWPTLYEYYLDGAQEQLSKGIYSFTHKGQLCVERVDRTTLRIGGRDYTCRSYRQSDASFIFRRLPMLNMLYRMLMYDLQQHYDIGLISHLF